MHSRKSKTSGGNEAEKAPPQMSDDEPCMTELELARIGVGHVAYLVVLTAKQARKAYPNIDGLPRGGMVFALRSADGDTIALTDTRTGALNHAVEGELYVQAVH